MMGKDELKSRDNWQTKSGKLALSLEESFYIAFKDEFAKYKQEKYLVIEKPNEFKNIYANIKLTAQTQKKIYTPAHTYKHGISVDFAIKNITNGKTLYVEIKRQDGWIEGLPPSAGRGNAHERTCKLFTPGLLDILRKKGNISDTNLPFWIVFGGNITRDPKRVREITCWFKGFGNHFFMWRNLDNNTDIIKHFNKHLKPLLQCNQNKEIIPKSICK